MAQDRIELNTYTCTSKYATINWRYDSPILKAGAVCGSSARTDLCGGCRVTGIPTATINGFVDNDILSRFSVLIDYPKQEIQFRELK